MRQRSINNSHQAPETLILILKHCYIKNNKRDSQQNIDPKIGRALLKPRDVLDTFFFQLFAFCVFFSTAFYRKGSPSDLALTHGVELKIFMRSDTRGIQTLTGMSAFKAPAPLHVAGHQRGQFCFALHPPLL